MEGVAWSKYMSLFENEKYMIVPNPSKNEILVFENSASKSKDQIIAYFHAYLVKTTIKKNREGSDVDFFGIVEQCTDKVGKDGTLFVESLEKAGWDVENTQFASERWKCEWNL